MAISSPAGEARNPTSQGSNGEKASAEWLPDSPRVVSSEALLAGSPYLAILHNQTIYFLRQTRFGKLILTK
jgi:hemin uptake protein HemP